MSVIELDPALTDADWAQDFEFYDGNEATPANFDGGVLSMKFVWGGGIAAPTNQTFELTSPTGGLIAPAPHKVGVRMTAAMLDGKLGGEWQYELRVTMPGGAIAALVTGQIPIVSGLTDGGNGASVVAIGGVVTGGTVKVIRNGGAVRVVRYPSGPAGRSAKQVLIDAGILPANMTDAAFATWLTSNSDASAASAAAAHADRLLADADAAATAADRVQTGLDRAATAADATATAADRVQTGLDRVQTGLDRVATGADRTAVAADKVTVAADKVTTLGYRDAALGYRNDALAAVTNVIGAPIGLTAGAEVTAASYVLTADDNGKLIPFNNAGRVIVYVDAGLPANFVFGALKSGAGDVEIWQGAGGLVNAPNCYQRVTTQYAWELLRHFSDALNIVDHGEAALPALSIDRALFDQSAASGLALAFFA